MPTISLRFYIYAALFVGAVAFFMCYDHLSNRVKEQDATIQKYADAYEKSKKQIKDSDSARTDYLTNLQAKQNEIDTIRNDVRAGTTVLRVAATCSKLSSSSTNTAGTTATAPELTEDARENYYSHRNDENKINGLLDLCIKTLQDERK